MDAGSNLVNSRTTHEEHLLYTHLLHCVKAENPQILIERFRRLFIQGTGYTPPQVWQALQSIVASQEAEERLKYVLNRSCYILINHWQKHPHFQGAIPELIHLFEQVPTHASCSRVTQRQRQLVSDFVKTEQYRALRHLAQVITGKTETTGKVAPLGDYIPRYPCLYEHCLLTSDSTDIERQKVRVIQHLNQQRFELYLSRYIAYRRLSKSTPKPKNPTLLSDRQLDLAIAHFTGKIDGIHTHRDLARQFALYSSRTRSYATFKEELYEYLVNSLDTKYRKSAFVQRLRDYLTQTNTHNDHKPLNDLLIVGTCRKLLNFLVVESERKPVHYTFLDLISNLGTTMTVGLLLKIILLCRNVKSYLEKQLSILFNHYESYSRDQVSWFVEILENLNIAWSLHFGSVKVC